MKTFLLLGALLMGLSLGSAAAQTQPRSKAAYHRTTTPRTKARSGAYARYDRSNRRDEENLKLAPGFRLNMPSPPTTDYMGRPLKKKPAKQPAGSTTISAETGKK